MPAGGWKYSMPLLEPLREINYSPSLSRGMGLKLLILGAHLWVVVL